LTKALLSYDPHQALKDLSKLLDKQLEIDCLEFLLKIPSDFGSGLISGYTFSDGIGLFIFDCRLIKGLEINFNTTEIPPLQFNLLLEGNVNHTFSNKEIDYSIEPLQGTITAAKSKMQNTFTLPAKEKVLLATMVIERAEYLKKIDCLIDEMPKELQSVFNDKDATSTFMHIGNFSIASSECVKTIIESKHKGLIRTTFTEGIALELLSCQIGQFVDDLVPKGKRVMLRKYDLKKIMEAKEILIDAIANPPTIRDLSIKVGLNQTKLKKGFKSVYNKPIKSWLRGKQLDYAKLLLLEDYLSIRQVAQKVGYANQSHFSRRFKEKFGVLPKDFNNTLKTDLTAYL